MNLSKILSRRTLLIVALTGFALSSMLLFYFILNSPVQSGSAQLFENAAASPKQEQANLPAGEAGFGLPLRLKIPAINVDSAIEYVGLAPNGAMDVPKSQNDVAWFQLGPRPGENGSAVMAGHYGIWKNGKGSVFDNLHKLSKGDKLYVEDDKGMIISFVVRESQSYDPNADARAVFVSNDGKPHLNLITCEGVWNKISRSYSKRLVVFADKVGPTSLDSELDSRSSPQE
ncbi:MAG: class F sortase [bacterium]